MEHPQSSTQQVIIAEADGIVLISSNSQTQKDKPPP